MKEQTSDCEADYFWRKAVDRATFADRVVNSLMTELGCKAEIYARSEPLTSNFVSTKSDWNLPTSANAKHHITKYFVYKINKK